MKMKQAERIYKQITGHSPLQQLSGIPKEWIIKCIDNAIPKGWVEFNSNEALFEICANNNCELLFEDGSECNFNDEHPMEIMTHFKIKL